MNKINRNVHKKHQNNIFFPETSNLRKKRTIKSQKLKILTHFGTNSTKNCPKNKTGDLAAKTTKLSILTTLKTIKIMILAPNQVNLVNLYKSFAIFLNHQTTSVNT